MQLPVINGAPTNDVAVVSLAFVGGAVSSIASPEMVVRLGLTEVVADEAAVWETVEIVDTEVRLMLDIALDNPAGEHPTKSGAVSLTAAHSSLLN